MNSLFVERLVGHSLGIYQIEQLMGQSKMSAVLLAQHSQHKHMVLLTIFLLPHVYSSPARERFNARFLRVAAAIAKLDHPCILPVNDFGEQGDYLYIVTPLITTTGSLAALLKQQSRLAPAEALEILRQVASGLDYAHGQGVIHGALKSTNIVLDSEQQVLIAGLGQATILQLRDIEEIQHPYMHLLSVARTFLGAPEYIAPEVVQGMPMDARADVYALGAMLFEMLCGEPPFSGMGPLTTALQHIERPVPSLCVSCPTLPLGLDLVVQQALTHNPAQRYQSAGELLDAFEHVLHVFDIAQMPVIQTRLGENQKSPVPFPTLPPGYDWFDEDAALIQQLEEVAVDEDRGGEVQMQPLDAVASRSSSRPLFLSQESIEDSVEPEQLDSPEEMSMDPFVWWSTTSLAAIERPDASQQHLNKPLASDLDAMNNTVSPLPRQEHSDRWSRRNRNRSEMNRGRRRAVALLATGGVAFLGALGIDGMMLLQRLQDVRAQAEASRNSQTQGMMKQPEPTPTEAPSPTPTEAPRPAPTEAPRPAPTQPSEPIAAPTEASNPTPTMQPGPTPTMQPGPTPTPGHNGTVVGSTNQGTNTSTTFTNPADGKKSLLVHLANGNFVAFESACPHEGATCHYDTGSQKIVCPRHDALFDPKNNAAVLQGPPRGPLTAVTVNVNADGTITIG